uniref:DLG associated protein 1 n=1 Tax=Fundulus heteroclitus TaxID=8078 RepID=A0A3Q2TFB8_FUNHE
VPPRTTPSKPFISITAQSSTESAQDAYMDGGPSQRAGISSQQGLSNSTESIDSMKALTAAIEAANAQYGEVGFDPSILPPPDPWMDSVPEPAAVEALEAVSRSVCSRDGRWFLKLLQAETERMEGWCRQMEQDEVENELPDEVLGKIRSAVGSAQLLMSQKFQQFRELCEENLNPNAHPRPVSQDLAGFWDMLQLSIENISLKFDELHQLKANNWKPLTPPEIQVRTHKHTRKKKKPYREFGNASVTSHALCCRRAAL